MVDALPGYGAFFMELYNVQFHLLVRLRMILPCLKLALEVMFAPRPETYAYEHEFFLLEVFIEVFFLFFHVPFPGYQHTLEKI
jgi:hypothetical protein